MVSIAGIGEVSNLKLMWVQSNDEDEKISLATSYLAQARDEIGRDLNLNLELEDDKKYLITVTEVVE